LNYLQKLVKSPDRPPTEAALSSISPPGWGRGVREKKGVLDVGGVRAGQKDNRDALYKNSG